MIGDQCPDSLDSPADGVVSGAHQQLHEDDLVLGCTMSFFQFALQMNFLPSLADGPPTAVHSQSIVPVSLLLLQV